MSSYAMRFGFRVPESHVSLIDKALAQGWKLDITRRGHIRMRSDKHIVITGGSPSDRRSYLNFRAQMKRCGVVLQ